MSFISGKLIDKVTLQGRPSEGACCLFGKVPLRQAHIQSLLRRNVYIDRRTDNPTYLKSTLFFQRRTSFSEPATNFTYQIFGRRHGGSGKDVALVQTLAVKGQNEQQNLDCAAGKDPRNNVRARRRGATAQTSLPLYRVTLYSTVIRSTYEVLQNILHVNTCVYSIYSTQYTILRLRPRYRN